MNLASPFQQHRRVAQRQSRRDRYRPRSGYSQGVTVPLKGGLKPGRYAVMWRLMSADGHPVTGQSVFTVR